jgi:alpha-methylacyl-CoA racemase
MLALYSQSRQSEGMHIEIAIADGARGLSDAVRFGLTSAGGALSGAFAGYALYCTADGWLALAALEPQFQQRILESLAVASLTREQLQARFIQQPTKYWEELAERDDLPLAGVSD